MAEVVDSIIAQLEVRLGNYVTNFDRASDAHERFTKSRPDKVGSFSTAEIQQYSDRHKQAGDAVVVASEKASRATKKKSADEVAAEKAAAAAAKQATKEKAAADRQAAKERAQAAKDVAKAEKQAQKEAADAAKARVQAERDVQTALARVRDGEIRDARRQREQLRQAREQEAQSTAQARVSAFLTPLGSRGLSGSSARSSADVFREQFRIEAQEAKVAAREEEALARARAKAGDAAAAAAAKEAQREANAARRVIRDRTPAPAAGGGVIGITVPREGTGQRSIPSSVLSGDAAAVAVEAEVNHLLADQAVLRSRLASASASEKRVIQERLADLRLEASLRRAGLDEEAILLRLEERRAFVAASRVEAEKKQAKRGLGGANEFALSATQGRFGYSFSPGAVAGIATAVGVGVGVQVIQSAVEYGKALNDLSKQLGVTVEDLQAYEKIARDIGVETTTLSSAFGQFASNLGRAQQGGEEQAKVFAALGIGIKDFKTAGDALPSVIDRISQIKEPLTRAAIETRLFGEEGRKLDPLLSGGAERVAQLSAALQETGRALSSKEIQELDETGRRLGEVKNQLQVDFARIVAGNADSIIGLANSFGILAGKITDTIGKLQQFGAAQIRASGLASASDKERARQFLLQTASGRERLLQENSVALRDNRAGNTRIDVSKGNVSAADVATRLAADRKRLLAERREILNAGNVAAPTPTAPVQTGTVNPGLISRLGSPKGPKGKSADQLEREAEQRTRQFNDQIASATAEYLRAQQQLTGDVDKRAEIEAQMLETAYAARLADIESQRKRNVLAGADAKLEDARADELRAAEKKARDANLSVIEQEKRFAKEQALTNATQSLLDARATALSAELSLARTTRERRRIQLELVDNQEKADRNRLQGIINSNPVDSDAAKQAQADLARVSGQAETQRRVVRDQNLDPLDQYKKDLHSATDDTEAALQSIEVNALQGLEDSLSRSIGKVLGLKGAFGDLVSSVLTDIARLEIKKGILSILEGNNGGGGFLSRALSALRIGGARASGGNVVGGQSYLVGENGPEIVNFGMSGRVYPNGSLPSIASGRGGISLSQTFNIDASGVNPTGFADAIISQVRRETGAAIRQSSAAMLSVTPAYIKREDSLSR